MDKNNPYQAPGADVYDVTAEGFDETSPLSPKGRFGRLSYLAWTTLISLSVSMVMVAVSGGFAAMQQDAFVGGAMFFALQIFAVVVMVFFAIRRFHDLNASGWWSLLMIVPVINLITGIVLVVMAGNVGENKYGFARQTRGWEKVVAYISIGMIILGVLGMIAAVIIPLVAA
jgi:uncharacterized membrane protein YhaH (DUF805 family)